MEKHRVKLSKEQEQECEEMRKADAENDALAERNFNGLVDSFLKMGVPEEWAIKCASEFESSDLTMDEVYEKWVTYNIN